MKPFNTLVLSALAICSCSAIAHDMTPAPQQITAVLLKNATVHTVVDGVKTNTDILLENGKIAAIGQALQAPAAYAIDLSGKHVYPGLIALDSTLGLTEISMVRSTNDTEDIGDDNPQLTAAAAYNPDSELLPTIRANGITHAQATPRGEGLAGQSVLVNLDAWTIEDATHASQPQLHLYWPKQAKRFADKEKNDKAAAAYQQALQQITNHFNAAYRYYLALNGKQKITEDSRWQAMLPLFAGQGKLYVHADHQQAIEQAAALARQYQLALVIVGGYDAWKVADQLKAQHAAVIYTHCLDLPERADDGIGLAFRIPALMQQAGLPFAIGFSGDWDSRNLPLAAAQTVAWGLTEEQALRAITYDAAAIIGAKGLGAIAVGYDASLAVSSGNILDPMSSKIEALFIDGRQIDLNNRHRQLYQKYLKR